MSGGAAATASQDWGSASLSSDDGTVDHVAVFGDSRVEWKGFEEEARSFEMDVEVGGNQVDGRVDLHTSGPHDLTADSWGGDGEIFSGAGTSGWIESDIGYTNGEQDESTYWLIIAPDGVTAG